MFSSSILELSSVIKIQNLTNRMHSTKNNITPQLLEYIINLLCWSNWISFQIIYLFTPVHCIYLFISWCLSILVSNNLNYFSLVEFSSRTSQEKSVYPKLPNVRKEIQQDLVKVLWSSSNVFKGRESLVIRYHPSYIVMIH